MLAPIAAALALLAPVQAQQVDSTGMVHGIVRSEATGEPLAYAVVEVDGVRPSVATADSLGRYVLRDVPAGFRVVRVSRFDHAPLEIEVLIPSGGRVALDFLLVQRPVVLPEIVAETNPVFSLADTLGASAPELSMAITRAIESTPGVIEMGLGQVAPVLPGQGPIDPSDVLYVRGAPAEMKLMLLDGAPVYSPFHLGGLIPAFDQELLRAADLHLGGAPARYDGGLSYVMGLETRAGRRSGIYSSGSIDLLSARGVVEGPLSHHAGFLVGSRTVHSAGSDWLVGGSFPYDYADVLARVDMDVSTEAALAVTGFWNRESVRLTDVPLEDGIATWGNRAASLRFRTALRGSLMEVTAAFGDYEARLPLDTDVVSDGGARRVRIAIDVSRGRQGARVQYGWSYESLSLEYEARYLGMPPNTSLFGTRADGAVVGSYVEVGWSPSQRWRIRSGLRGDIFSTDKAFRLAPRVAATWIASDRVTVTLAAGRYRQLVRPTEAVVVIPDDTASQLNGGTVISAPVIRSLYTADMKVARSSHVVLALDQELGEGVRLGVEGYYKHFDKVPMPDTALVEPGPKAYQTTGVNSVNSSGVDIWLRRAEGRFTGWLGYSLGWIWTSSRSATSDHFAGRHILSLGLSGPIAGLGQFDLRVSYGAGLPYSAVARVVPDRSGPLVLRESRFATTRLGSFEHVTLSAAPLTATPDEPYLRVDLELSRPWSGRWLGRQVDFTPYFKLLNALDRRDALFYAANGSGGQPSPLAALPILPVVGFSWKF